MGAFVRVRNGERGVDVAALGAYWGMDGGAGVDRAVGGESCRGCRIGGGGWVVSGAGG